MIYYVSLDNPHPSGGVKTQYRHVEILNAAGYPARMLHQEPGFTAARWFESKAPISYIKQTEIRPGDVLVWPEILRSSIQRIEGVKNVIFNQNVHYTWRGSLLLGGLSDESFRYEENTVGTMVLTEYEQSFLRSVVNGKHRVGVVHHGIDPTIFTYSGSPKVQEIAYMPRKHRDEAEAVFGWLRCIGALAGWSVVPIDGVSEEVSSRILQRAAFFFAFGYPEGGTLPPFEAMACGTKVIGYGGFASDSLLSEAGGIRIPSGDTCRFVAVAASELRGYVENVEVSNALSKRVLGMFPMEGERDQLLSFMRETGCIS